MAIFGLLATVVISTMAISAFRVIEAKLALLQYANALGRETVLHGLSSSQYGSLAHLPTGTQITDVAITPIGSCIGLSVKVTGHVQSLWFFDLHATLGQFQISVRDFEPVDAYRASSWNKYGCG